MQKCIAISTLGARFAALAVKENFRDSIRKVAELGYDAVGKRRRRGFFKIC